MEESKAKSNVEEGSVVEIRHGGGAFVGGDVAVSGDFVGRDKIYTSIISTRKPLPFNSLSPSEFERMCLWLVEREGYLRPQYLVDTDSEQRRDVVAYKPTDVAEELWYFMCKRYKRIDAATLKKEVDRYNTLAQIDPAKRPTGFVFVTNAVISARTRDKVAAYCQELGYSCRFWAHTELDVLVKGHPDVVREFFSYAPAEPSTVDIHPMLQTLRKEVAIQAPAGTKIDALEMIDSLEKSLQGKNLDFRTLYYVKRWFEGNAPESVGTLTSIVLQFVQAYALLIGVGDYTHPRFTNLPTTIRDVRALAAVLNDPNRCSYPQDNVRVITGEQATVTNIREALQALAQSTNAQSTVFIYFSGHAGRALEIGTWRTYLCPHEADPDDLTHTATPGDEFSNLLAAIPAQNLLVVLDVSHPDSMAEPKTADGSTVWRSGLPDSYYEVLSRGSGCVVIASSREDQCSYIRKKGDLSLFTWHFLEALSGKAAVRGDGLIRVLDVFHYVSEAVQANEPKQVPILKIKDLDLNFPIALDRGGKGAGPAISVTPITDIREQIVRDPIAGAKALSEYLGTRPEWASKRNEVDLKRADLERIQHDLDLFGPSSGDQAAKNRAVYFLLRVCLELEQSDL